MFLMPQVLSQVVYEQKHCLKLPGKNCKGNFHFRIFRVRFSDSTLPKIAGNAFATTFNKHNIQNDP